MRWTCKNCKTTYYFREQSKGCNCKKFTVVDAEGEEHIYYADFEREVAFKYAEKTNVDHDYWLMNQETDITVINEQGHVYSFTVGAEPNVHYSCSDGELEQDQ